MWTDLFVLIMFYHLLLPMSNESWPTTPRASSALSLRLRKKKELKNKYAFFLEGQTFNLMRATNDYVYHWYDSWWVFFNRFLAINRVANRFLIYCESVLHHINCVKNLLSGVMYVDRYWWCNNFNNIKKC